MNEFSKVGLKGRLLNIWYTRKKYVIIFLFSVVLIGISLILILNNKTIDNSKYESIESIMVYNAQKYIKNNDIENDIFVPLNYLNIKIDNNLGCNSSSGVWIQEGEYFPYLICKSYNSKTVQEVLNQNKTNRQYGTLKGDNPYVLTDDNYQELGIDVKEGYVVSIQNNNIDNGVNIVKYNILKNNEYVVSLKRIVIAENIIGSSPVIELVGNMTRTININNPYIESGYSAIDKIDGDITSKVRIEGIVDITRAGSYTLIYSVTNSRGQQTKAKRIIIVNDNNIELDITHSITPTEITTNGVTIKLKIDGNGYKSTTLPNGEKTESTNPTYTVYKNGSYEFTIYDKNENSEVYIVKIKNASVLTLSGSCSAKLDNGVLSITNEIISNNNVDYYIYKSGTLTSDKTQEKTFSLSSTNNDLTVTVFDIYGSSETKTCSVSEIYNNYIITGDSRTAGMSGHVKSIAVNTTFVAKSAMRYDWFASEAVSRITKIINSSNTKYYIVVVFGVNDLAGKADPIEKAQKYLNKVNYLVVNDWSKAKVIFLSVNPAFDGARNDASIRTFNERIKSGLSENAYYCDTYTPLKDQLSKLSNDGLHYTPAGSRLIYRYILDHCRF